MMLKAVIFDFNGVIIDDYPIQKEAWNRMSKIIRGTEVTDEEMIKQIRGVPTVDTIKRMSEDKLEMLKIAELSLKKEKIVQEIIDTSPLFRLNKGLEIFLDRLKDKKIPRTIATSLSKEMFYFLANRLHLDVWFAFDTIIYSDGTHKGKPAPDSYILAAKAIGVSPSECVVFEDARSGIQSAYEAGCNNIVVVNTDDRLEVLTKLPGVVRGIHDFSEITVESLFGLTK